MHYILTFILISKMWLVLASLASVRSLVFCLVNHVNDENSCVAVQWRWIWELGVVSAYFTTPISLFPQKYGCSRDILDSYLSGRSSGISILSIHLSMLPRGHSKRTSPWGGGRGIPKRWQLLFETTWSIVFLVTRGEGRKNAILVVTSFLNGPLLRLYLS